MHALNQLAAALPAWWPMSPGASLSMEKLLLAMLLGGAVGLERELKHRPAGLRTNLFICFGSALFTILSERLALVDGDRTRIAAQIITGIGFIGAGTILHEKGSVSGLTSAASIFVVAGIGMAAGGGLYGTAIVATVLVVFVFLGLGQVETHFNLKPITKAYDVISSECDSPESLTAELNQILENNRLTMQTVHIGKTDETHCKITFSVEGYLSNQRALEQQIRSLPSVMTMASAIVADRD
jgi:putative Mg2+ transporter-C (MgtC) family protein